MFAIPPFVFFRDVIPSVSIFSDFRFLMELKRNNVELFLTKFTRQGVIASKAKKRCVALQTGNWVQCSLCSGSGKDNCPIPEAFEFKNAMAEIQKHIQQIKSENQR